MNHRHLTIGSTLIGALLLATITRADAPATGPTSQNEVAALRQTVTELVTQNTKLQRQVAELQQQLRLAQSPRITIPNQPRFNFEVSPKLTIPTIPPDAVPHLFNGGIYYTIPVNAQPK
jgi:hypothetical protein